jgi:hypothetical protein
MRQPMLPFAEIKRDAEIEAQQSRRHTIHALLLVCSFVAFLFVMFHVEVPIYCNYCHQKVGGRCVAAWLVTRAECRSDNTCHWKCFWDRNPPPPDPRPH